jgi:hypothetical protein
MPLPPTLIFQEILDELEDLKLQQGTPEYDRALCAARVRKCKELRNVDRCPDCSHFEQCDLAKENLVVLKYRRK